MLMFTTNSLRDEAIQFAKSGNRVLPLREKKPRGDLAPRGVHSASSDIEQVTKWWTSAPDADIGIATGAGLLVVDIDPRNGGSESVALLEKDIGSIPVTRRVRTGGGGEHIYLKVPPGVVVRCRSNIYPGIDIKGDGGYVVAPPSIHETGECYEWMNAFPIADAPKALLSLISEAPRHIGTSSMSLEQSEVREGGRNCYLASMAGTIRNRGVGRETLEKVLLAVNKDICVPPLPEHEVRTIAASIARYPVEEASTWATHEVARLDQLLESWPDPIPLVAREEDSSRFPTEAFPAPIRKFVEGVAESTQTPPEMVSVLVLTAFATICAKRARVCLDHRWQEPLCLYGVVVMSPANRKSAVAKEVVRPLNAIEEELRKEHQANLEKSATRRGVLEDALKAAQKRAAKHPEEREEEILKADELAKQLKELPSPWAPRLLADDVTPEAAAVLMSRNSGRLAIIAGETDFFEILAGRYSNQGSPNIGLVLQGHSGDFLRVDRLNRDSVSIDEPALTLGLCVQPSVLRDIGSNSQFRGRGFVARILFSMPKSTIGSRKLAPPKLELPVVFGYDTCIRKTFKVLGMPGKDAIVHELRLAVGASDVFLRCRARYENALREGGELSGDLIGWAGKMPGQIARIAALITLMEDPSKRLIDKSTMERAVSIGEYFVAQAKAVFRTMGASQSMVDARRLLDWIRDGRRDRFKSSEARAENRSWIKTAKRTAAALQVLEDHGFVRQLPQPPNGRKGGRPQSTNYVINPKVFGVFGVSGDGETGEGGTQ